MGMLERGELGHIQALDLLAEGSRILASSFELSATLPQVAQLCADRLAEYCCIYTLRTDEGDLVVEAGAVRLEPADQPALLKALKKRGFKAIITSPLRGRQPVAGTLILAAHSADSFDPSVQKLADVLGLQIANALDQAVLFERTHRVADRLQRALLPQTFPRVPGGKLDAAYRPASDEAEVGGDWYDAFELPDGRIAISMGDVAGHGLEAATIMGEVRQAMRAAALGERSPAAVLEHINRVVSFRSNIGMVTAIFGYYEPRLRQLTYAVAGHPPPALIISRGFSGYLPGGGVPLGVGESIDATDWVVTLAPRSWVIFYTDGMTEYEKDVIVGEERLLEASVRACESDPENPALALQERIFNATVNRDDAATLTLSCFEGAVPDSLAYSAIPLAAPIVRSIMHRYCDQEHLGEDQRFSIIASVGEAIANAVEHAYMGNTAGLIDVRLDSDQENISIEIEDHGQWRPFQRRDERGRGMLLMHELMDRVRITSAQKGTILNLVLRR